MMMVLVGPPVPNDGNDYGDDDQEECHSMVTKGWV